MPFGIDWINYSPFPAIIRQRLYSSAGKFGKLGMCCGGKVIMSPLGKVEMSP